MTWTPERTTINQRVQVGAESTSALGTVVPSNKLLECFDWTFGINGDVNTYTPTGHKYANTQEENTEWVDGTMGGNLDYNGAVYPLSSIMGSIGVASHSGSSVAKDWVFSPPTYGSVVPQTYTIEQGDSVRAHRFAYGIFTQFGYKGTRKDFTCSGKLLGQPITDGVTLTSTPAAVAIAPVVAKQVNVYLDPAYSALGTTQLTRVLSIDYSMDSVYAPLWVLNRSNIGYTAHVDTMPKCDIKLKVEADATGMALLTSLQGNTTQYLRVQARGDVIDNNQTVTISRFSRRRNIYPDLQRTDDSRNCVQCCGICCTDSSVIALHLSGRDSNCSG
jgi:hypothetical protein